MLTMLLPYSGPAHPERTAKVLAEIVERLGPFPVTFCYKGKKDK